MTEMIDMLRLSAIIMVLTLSATLVACGTHGPNLGSVAEESVRAIVLEAAKDELVAIVDEYPPVGVVVLVAVVGFYLEESALKHARASAPDATFLIVRQAIHGKVMASIFRITTTHTLVVALNGMFVESIAPHQIVIDVAPNTSSTIVVSGGRPMSLVYRQGTISLYFIHELANLDTGIDKNVPPSQAELQMKSFPLGLSSEEVVVNGTMVASWKGRGQPSLANCASLPPSQWSTVVIGYTHRPLPGAAWCIYTSQHRYGVIVVKTYVNPFEYIPYAPVDPHTSFVQFAYILWKKRSDR